MAYDPVSFFTGYAVGRLSRGYASRPGTAFVAHPVGVRVRFYEWAAANSGSVIYDSPAAYQSYAAALPLTDVGPDNSFYWTPPIVTVYIGSSAGSALPDDVWGNPEYIVWFVNPGSAEKTYEAFFDMKTLSGEVGPTSGKGYFFPTVAVCSVQAGTIPLSGIYKGVAGVSGRYTYQGGMIIKSGSNTGQLKDIYSGSSAFRYTSGASGIHYHAGESFFVRRSLFVTPSTINNNYGIAGVSFQIYPQTYLVAPYSWETSDADILADSNALSAARAGNIRGAFEISLNGETSLSPRDYIISESEKTVYNPVTNQSFAFSDWSYNYQTRTYTLSLTELSADDNAAADESSSDAADDNAAGNDAADDTAAENQSDAASASIIFGDSSVIITDFSGNSSTIYYSLK